MNPLLATIPPTAGQRRTVRILMLALFASVLVTWPFGSIKLSTIDGFVPANAAALFIINGVTAVLLFGQFAILRTRALLVIANGYVLSGLMVVAHALAFPGAFSPTGLNNAGPQSAILLYSFWHEALPLAAIWYALIKDTDRTISTASTRMVIGVSVAAMVVLAGAIFWLLTKYQALLPVTYIDVNPLGFWRRKAGGIVDVAISGAALCVLWARRRTLLDEWLLVALCAIVTELLLAAILTSDRFTVAWYAARLYQIVTATVVMVVLLAEMTNLYANITRSNAALRERESTAQMFLNSIPAAVSFLSLTGETELVNDQLLEYFGVPLDELKDWANGDLIHPDDRAVAFARFAHWMKTGEGIDHVYRLRRFDRIYRYVHVRSAPLRNASGQTVGWCTIHIDVDERMRAEEALRASEVNLRKTIDTIPALVWSARVDGSVEYFSQHYLVYLGQSLAQAQDWGWSAAVHPDDLGGLAATWQAIRASGKAGEAEARLRGASGEYRWFLFRANPLRNEYGDIVNWYGVNTDIEDRRGVEEDLRRSEGFLAAGQRLSLTGTFLWRSATGDFTWSEELYRIYEFPREARITFELIASRYHPEDKHRVAEIARQARNGVPTFDYGHRLLMPNGSIKHLHVVAHGRVDKDGNGLEYFGAVQDVTQRRLAEEARDRARSELAHVTRVMSLGALTASIAHEVSQPLAGILTNANTCLRMLGADPPNIEGALETARRTIRDGNRATDVITRLRALFARKAAVTETLDMNGAAREVLSLLSDDLLRNRVVARVELDDAPLFVTGDRVQLQQVILNLVRNASDAMADVDDRPRHLLIRVDGEEKGCARLIVTDAGTGFASKDAERLFDPFYTTKSGGIGIGLSLSRSIIESHGGRLWAKPNDGPGATFSFSIPRLDGRATDEASASPPQIETRG
jgi:PAS domain S-box-containing protein